MACAEKGFSLIELLVVISIIALLSTIAMTSVTSQRNRARNVSFQSAAKGVQSGAGICCNSENGTLNITLGEDICTPASGSLYPTASNLGSVEIIRGCSDLQGFSIKLTPGTSNIATLSHALCDRDGCEFIPS